MCTSQGSCASTRITLSASAVTVERSEFITRTSSPCKRPSWFSQSAGYFSRSDRVRASKSLDIRSLAAQEDKKDMGREGHGHTLQSWAGEGGPCVACPSLGFFLLYP